MSVIYQYIEMSGHDSSTRPSFRLSLNILTSPSRAALLDKGVFCGVLVDLKGSWIVGITLEETY